MSAWDAGACNPRGDDAAFDAGAICGDDGLIVVEVASGKTGSVSLKRFVQVQVRVAYGLRRALGGRDWTYLIVVECLRDGCLAGPGIEPPSAAVSLA
mmetsp:Transcript_32661/g.104259  ORF Transcript_32661/g.104259 Transcript_32661/m.104259 type:complete len:97 (+) Transcript_32661:234-524(+)